MHQDFPPVRLAQWQQEFFERYLSSPKARTLLVAPTGAGKTVASLYVIRRMLDDKVVNRALFVSDHRSLVEHWRHTANTYGLDLAENLDSESELNDGIATTIQSLQSHHDPLIVEKLASSSWVIIVDEAHRLTRPVVDLTDRFLSLNNETKVLFISQRVMAGFAFDAEYCFGTELIFRRNVLESPKTENRIRRYAPSFGLLRQLQRSNHHLSDLTWRQFEKLVANLLEADGYTVELMRGTKDGGVDIVATKDLGVSGLFKGVWQAKKLSGTRKVGIATVRELADTRVEFGASKGLIVTSTYLTHGALQRIERDRYTLGKVDEKDLDAWIDRILRGERNV